MPTTNMNSRTLHISKHPFVQSESRNPNHVGAKAQTHLANGAAHSSRLKAKAFHAARPPHIKSTSAAYGNFPLALRRFFSTPLSRDSIETWPIIGRLPVLLVKIWRHAWCRFSIRPNGSSWSPTDCEPEPMAAEQAKGCTTPSFSLSHSLTARLGTARRAEGRIWMLAEKCRSARTLQLCAPGNRRCDTHSLRDRNFLH